MSLMVGNNKGWNTERRTASSAAAMIGLLALTMSACGSGTKSSAGSGGSSNALASGAAASPGGSSCDLGHVKEKIDAHKVIADWTAPGPAFDAKKASGATIYTIQENTANPFSATIVTGIKEVASKVGIKVVDYPNQGDRTQWQQGIQQAITAKAGGIIFVGGTIGPIYFKAQAEEAKRAGLKLVTVVDTDLTQPAEPLTDARVAQPYAEAARLNADWIINDTQCKANVLILTSNELIAGDINTKAAKDEFDKYCGSGCKVTDKNIPIPKWSSQIQPTVQSGIQSTPDLNYVFPLYDSMIQFVTPAIQLAGANARVKITSFNGTPAFLQLIKSGNTVKSIVGENEANLGYAGMDQMMRLLTGLPAVTSGDEHIPLRVFDASNVAEAGNPPAFGVGYGDKWRQGYMKLWGLAK